MNYYMTITPLVACGLSLALAILVLQRNIKSNSHRMFSLFLMGMALWGGIIFFMRISPNPTAALLWDKAVMPVFVLTAISFWHFSLLKTRCRTRRRSLLIPYLFLLIVMALSPTDMIVKGIGEDIYGYFPIAGNLFYLIPLSAYCFYILGLVNFVKGYNRSSSYEERNSYIYIIIGVSSFLLAGMAELLVIFGISIPPPALVGNILFAILASIALLKYRLLDMHIVLRKGIAYILMSALIALPYIGVILLFHNLFEGIEPFWIYLILLLLLALLLQPLWGRLQRWVDKLFFRSRYDYLKELENFSQEIHDISDLGHLCFSLVQLISRALQCSGVYLLLSSSTGEFNLVCITGRTNTRFTINSESPLLVWFRSKKGMLHSQDLDIIPQLQAMPMRERNELKKMGAELLFPLKTKQDELVGIIILGKKISHQPYSQEDKQLISTLATQVATELHNARLYNQEMTLRRELEKQNEEKTEFLHGVAHELKTPLTAILSSSELLNENSPMPGDIQKRLINNVQQSALSMNRRVHELLDLADLQIGEMKINPKPLAISETIITVVQQLQVIFENKKQTLSLAMGKTLPETYGDEDKLEQLLFNLLSNANKFSPPNSKVTLRAKEVDNQIIVEVEDSALKVTEEEKERLFDPYYRGDDVERRTRFPGLGLGLAIAKKIVELHHGKIWIGHKKTHGNIFAFSLPVYKQNVNAKY